ncbi:hypothetical protein EJF36_05635 [Bacillus sp. HMF5848]|uniref:RCC1 domain-containing protein n=1 Tax=Bacillus sp. HMF5848 TaxID=2495421 RepID=UPI000F78E875|nr:Ig-like domain-containing protein [Bacillus sp. HMF5848]RSK26380.1 hypothetical protein EJF36_05635 [Bacillus sp. HMF5848]
MKKILSIILSLALVLLSMPAISWAEDTWRQNELKIIDVIATKNNTYALSQDGTLWSWGSKYYLGNNDNSVDYTVPNIATNFSKNIIDIEAAYNFTANGTVLFALEEDSKVKGMGFSYSSLFPGPTSAKEPVDLNLSDISHVSIGEDHALALTVTGDVYGWGSNSRASFSTKSETKITEPTTIDFDEKIVKVAAGYDFQSAMSEDGDVYTWGRGELKQLGREVEYDNEPAQLQFPTAEKIIDIENGYRTGFALTSSGEVYGWGFNDSGILGVNALGAKVLTPVKIEGLTNIVTLSASKKHGHAFLLALDNKGDVWGIGGNENSILGAGIGFNVDTPVKIDFQGEKIRAVDAGHQHAVALTENGHVYTWGLDSVGSLGLGEEWSFYTTPQRVKFQTEPSNENVEIVGLKIRDIQLPIYKGQTKYLQPIFTPMYATNQNIVWESSDPNIIDINEYGKITAISAGTAEISVSSAGVSASIIVTVLEDIVYVPVEGIEFDTDTLKLSVDDDPFTLVPTIYPDNATNQSVNWSSSDEAVVTVDRDGTVTPHSAGTAQIIATTEDGEYTATVYVTVTNVEPPITSEPQLGDKMVWLDKSLDFQNVIDFIRPIMKKETNLHVHLEHDVQIKEAKVTVIINGTVEKELMLQDEGDGIWGTSISPQDDETGVWSIIAVHIDDALGNTFTLDMSDVTYSSDTSYEYDVDDPVQFHFYVLPDNYNFFGEEYESFKVTETNNIVKLNFSNVLDPESIDLDSFVYIIDDSLKTAEAPLNTNIVQDGYTLELVGDKSITLTLDPSKWEDQSRLVLVVHDTITDVDGNQLINPSYLVLEIMNEES